MAKKISQSIVIHKRQISKTKTTYYFTKSKNRCLCIEYDKSWDFGKDSPSGTQIHFIEIHHQNSFVKDNLTETTLQDIPMAVIDILSYLS